MLMISKLRSLGLAGLVMASLVGCGASPDSAAPSSEPVETSTTLPDPVPIVGVYDAVGFYPACGNEVLSHLGRRWYPIVHDGLDPADRDLQDEVDAALAVDREEPPVAVMQGLTRVAPPGLGDDTGTLVVWADGVARWASDSGDLDVWMIDDVITYNWVC